MQVISGRLVPVSILITCVLLSCKNAGIEDPEPLQQETLLYEIDQRTYISTVFGAVIRPVNVCLPSDYDTLSGLLPVLYLLHGAGGDEFSWIRDGHIVEKLSSLYDEGSISPMVVVTMANLPIGSNFMGVGPEGDPFVQEFVTDIMPFIEDNYRASFLREYRAIGGLSAGGIQTLNLGLFFPDSFGYVYPMSTGYFESGLDTLNSEHYDDVLDNPEINNLIEFTLSCGSNDWLFYNPIDPDNTLFQKTLNLLDDHGIQYESVIDEGYFHSWKYWRLCFDRLILEVFQ